MNGDALSLSRSADVLIVGAGIAGLACARRLAEKGLQVCLVEATSRVGGRIRSEYRGDQTIELGAEFVHGRPPELLRLIAEAGLTLCEREGTQVSFDDGRLRAEDPDARDATSEPLDRLRDWSAPDLSFRDSLEGCTGLDAHSREAALGYVEGFNAADAGQISAISLGRQQRAEDAMDGDRVAHVQEGYERVPRFLAERFLAANGDLRLDTAVRSVRWGVGRVALETTNGELIAPRAVLTLPLAVLQAGSVAIVPEPRRVLSAAAQMRMGQVCRFTLVFRERFWQHLPPQPALSELSFVFDFGELPSVWWTTHPEPGGRSMTGWVGGPRAAPLLGKPIEELARLGCRALARLFGVPEAEVRAGLEACHSHDWQTDANALGSYSYVAVGGIDASTHMAEPVERTLFFAGEHTDVTGHWGTVHGALRSGERAARQVLQQTSLQP